LLENEVVVPRNPDDLASRLALKPGAKRAVEPLGLESGRVVLHGRQVAGEQQQVASGNGGRKIAVQIGQRYNLHADSSGKRNQGLPCFRVADGPAHGRPIQHGGGFVSFPGPFGSPRLSLERSTHARTTTTLVAAASVGGSPRGDWRLAVPCGVGVLLLRCQGQGHPAAGAEGVHYLGPGREG